ncbi:hypothetical protein NS115_03545 [Paenibacillus jamilae]|uniref:Uncharacterized protein n=3 Tax=Bacillales TaxID=1385 RepID=A0ACC4ZZC8_9BACL|nr:hypothetical protein NS115_03545 [Paenibacillus jamilae]
MNIMENTQNIRQLAKQRLQEIHAQLYVLSEEAKQINAFLSLRDQEDGLTAVPEIPTDTPE